MRKKTNVHSANLGVCDSLCRRHIQVQNIFNTAKKYVLNTYQRVTVTREHPSSHHCPAVNWKRTPSNSPRPRRHLCCSSRVAAERRALYRGADCTTLRPNPPRPWRFSYLLDQWAAVNELASAGGPGVWEIRGWKCIKNIVKNLVFVIVSSSGVGTFVANQRS